MTMMSARWAVVRNIDDSFSVEDRSTSRAVPCHVASIPTTASINGLYNIPSHGEEEGVRIAIATVAGPRLRRWAPPGREPPMEVSSTSATDCGAGVVDSSLQIHYVT